MDKRFNEELFLTNETGRRLFHAYAERLPIIDYHCHLLPQEIYENKQFEDLGEMWLAHDHYKWRAMRAFGIDERLITGSASYRDKFLAFAGIFPELIGNPLYVWCTLELSRYFGIDEPLSPENAQAVYRRAGEMIKEKRMGPRYFMEASNVEFVSTTEDPVDDLRYHGLLQNEKDFCVKVVSAFRPDKAMYCEKETFPAYLPQLEAAAGMKIDRFHDLIAALEKRLAVFAAIGSAVSDCGLEYFHWRDYTERDVDGILSKARAGEPLSDSEIDRYRTAFLLELARMYERNGFVMQLHVGTLKNANAAMFRALGPDTGYDCTRSGSDIESLSLLLDALNTEGRLPKTILYPLNGIDTEAYAVLAAGFCRGPVRGLVQLGAPWWFNDQVYGIERQFEAAANLYPIALSVGMLTDSRSFLSYPRHELYRRLLCNYFGKLIERGEYFSDEAALRNIIENICYRNVKAFFGI